MRYRFFKSSEILYVDKDQIFNKNKIRFHEGILEFLRLIISAFGSDLCSEAADVCVDR